MPHPYFPVELVKLSEPIGDTTHALMKCPRCLKGIGVTMAMLAKVDSIICKSPLGGTGFICNGHYFFDVDKGALKFVGTVNN